jgi:hypothetical protein
MYTCSINVQYPGVQLVQTFCIHDCVCVCVCVCVCGCAAYIIHAGETYTGPGTVCSMAHDHMSD